jgi:tRNA1(Val) A37 N6-methylase TrmN6
MGVGLILALNVDQLRDKAAFAVDELASRLDTLPHGDVIVHNSPFFQRRRQRARQSKSMSFSHPLYMWSVR